MLQMFNMLKEAAYVRNKERKRKKKRYAMKETQRKISVVDIEVKKKNTHT